MEKGNPEKKAKYHLEIQTWKSLKEKTWEMRNEESQKPKSTSSYLLVKKRKDQIPTSQWFVACAHIPMILPLGCFHTLCKRSNLSTSYFSKPHPLTWAGIWTGGRFLCMTKTINCPLFPPEVFPQGSWKPECTGGSGSLPWLHWIKYL